MATVLAGSLEEILISIQHHDQGIRRSGEIQYHQLQNLPEYVEIVTQFASDGTKPTHFRQLVMLLLNQQISKDWKLFTQQSRGALVQFSLSGCGNDISIIRHAAMHMLSRIVSRSTRAESRDIINHLSSQLMVHDVFVVTSTLRCLCTIAEEGKLPTRFSSVFLLVLSLLNNNNEHIHAFTAFWSSFLISSYLYDFRFFSCCNVSFMRVIRLICVLLFTSYECYDITIYVLWPALTMTMGPVVSKRTLDRQVTSSGPESQQGHHFSFIRADDVYKSDQLHQHGDLQNL